MNKLAAGVPSESYAQWGGEIATNYLKGGVSMHDGVKKVAQENSLNPEQIRRTAEAANIAAYQQSLPDRGGGDVRFDPVRGADVVRDLNGPEKVASISSVDYNSMPPTLTQVKVAELRAFPQAYIQDEMVKESERREDADAGYLSHGDVLALVGKLETCKDELMCKRATEYSRTEAALCRLTEDVRLSLMDGNDIDDIVKLSIAARPEHKELVTDVFGHVISKLAAKGYIKIGGHVKVGVLVDPKLISSKLKELSPGVEVKVINGSHPIFKSLDMCNDVRFDKKKNDEGLSIVDDKLKKAKKVLINFGKKKAA